MVIGNKIDNTKLKDETSKFCDDNWNKLADVIIYGIRAIIISKVFTPISISFSFLTRFQRI